MKGENMKKFAVFGIVALAGIAAIAEMDSKKFTGTVIGTGTNSSSLVIRGTLEALKVDFATGATGTVKVTSAELTLFEKATIGADTTFLPVAATHTTAGAAATFVGGTNNVANAWYAKQPMAGDVTVRVIGESAGVTNAYTVTAVFSK
jgi:hypothetical protein